MGGHAVRLGAAALNGMRADGSHGYTREGVPSEFEHVRSLGLRKAAAKQR